MSNTMELWSRIKAIIPHELQERIESLNLMPHVLYQAKQHFILFNEYKPVYFFISFKPASLERSLSSGLFDWGRVAVVYVEIDSINERGYRAYAAPYDLDKLLLDKWVDVELADLSEFTQTEILQLFIDREF